MDIKVFFSWQNEKPESGNLILTELQCVCEELSDLFKINLSIIIPEAAQRSNINPFILDKAEITIADFTPASIGFDGSLIPNAKVIFEYGLSQAVLGSENVIAVMDTKGIKFDKMPFDFKDSKFVGFCSSAKESPRKALKNLLQSIIEAKLTPILHDATTVFFSRKIASGFPGVRNIKWYVDPDEIKLHLDAFFKSPIKFREATHREGDTEPIWWFRGEYNEAIVHYEALGNGIFLIGDNELKIKGIAVYSDASRYFREYIYIETTPMHPFDKEYYTPDRIEELARKMDYVDEEYAVFNDGNTCVEISKAESDDGYAEINGEIIPVHGRTSPRCRFLTPFNMIIASKYSPYNSTLFSMGSNHYFNGVLKGTIKFEDFHKYLMDLPKFLHF